LVDNSLFVGHDLIRSVSIHAAAGCGSQGQIDLGLERYGSSHWTNVDPEITAYFWFEKLLTQWEVDHLDFNLVSLSTSFNPRFQGTASIG